MTNIRLLRGIVLSAMFVSVFAFTALAQKSHSVNSTSKNFQSFYAKFKAAVVRGDKNAVARMSRFPFKYGFDAGDEGTFSRRQFIDKFNDIFGGDRKIFFKKNPAFFLDSSIYDLMDSDDASHFIFSKVGTSYKLTAYIVEP